MINNRRDKAAWSVWRYAIWAVWISISSLCKGAGLEVTPIRSEEVSWIYTMKLRHYHNRINCWFEKISFHMWRCSFYFIQRKEIHNDADMKDSWRRSIYNKEIFRKARPEWMKTTFWVIMVEMVSGQVSIELDICRYVLSTLRWCWRYHEEVWPLMHVTPWKCGSLRCGQDFLESDIWPPQAPKMLTMP